MSFLSLLPYVLCFNVTESNMSALHACRYFCWCCGWILTVSPDVEAEGGLQLTDFVPDTDVQTVVASRGEGEVQFQHVVI